MINRIVTLSEILNFLGDMVLRVEGRLDDVYVDNLADVENVNETTLDWINPNRINKQQIAQNTKAKVILVDPSIESVPGKTLITVSNPKIALALVGNEFFAPKYRAGIHPTAIVSSNARIGEGVHIGPYCVLDDCEVGENTIISSNVHIYSNVRVGVNCIIKEGAVIGGTGFGFEVDGDGNRFRFPQIGSVIIGDNVEIGANTCIDRGSLSDTIIDDYAKIDNLCHIAHNVHIGRNAIITACSEVSGSCIIGNNAWLGPNVSVRDWRSVGNQSLIGIGSVVVKNVPENEVWAGNPAKSMNRN